jgi:hypothetical protein
MKKGRTTSWPGRILGVGFAAKLERSNSIDRTWASKNIVTSPKGARHEKLPGVASTRADPRRFAGSLLFFAPVIQLHKKREHLGR